MNWHPSGLLLIAMVDCDEFLPFTQLQPPFPEARGNSFQHLPSLKNEPPAPAQVSISMIICSVCLSHPKVVLADLSFCCLFLRLTLAIQGPFQFDIIGFKTVSHMSQADFNLSDLSASTF